MAAPPMPTPAVLHERLLARLRLRHLRLVEALAEHRHLRHAAEAVHVSQPAATQMLHEIETLLGVSLFERHARGMRITDAGRRLALHARLTIESLRVAVDELHALTAQQARPLRVGAIDSAIAAVLRSALPALHAAHPWMRLRIEVRDTEELTSGLRGGAYDLVLLRRPPRLEAGQRFVLLRSDRIVLVVGAAHPAARRRRVRLADLADSRWVLPPSHYAVRRALDAAWAREPRQPREHPVQTLAPELLPQLLTEPDVVAPMPQSTLAGFGDEALVELALDIQIPIEPMGMLIRGGEQEPALVVLTDFLAARADPGLSGKRGLQRLPSP